MKRHVGGAIAGAAGSIAILTLLSRIVGFVRVWVQNGSLGDTLSGVAYSTSNTVPNVLFEVAAGGALAGAVIPLISGFLARGMRQQMSATASALITWILAIGVPLAVLVCLAAEPVTRALLGTGAPEAQVELATELLRMFAWQIPLYGLSVVLTGILQAHNKFILPAVAPLLSSVVVIGAFLEFSQAAHGAQDHPELLSGSAIAWLGWGTTAGVVVFSLPQLIPVMRLVRVRPSFTFPAGVARRAVRLAGAGMGGLLAQQIQIVVIMVVANTQGGAGGTGAYPVYTFANAVYMVPYAVLAVPIATAVFPRLSAAAAVPGRPGMEQLTARSTRLVLDIGIVCVALLVVLAHPAKLVFDALRPAAGLDIALMAMAPGLVGYALIYHCSRVLYAVEASRAVVLVNSVAWLAVCVILGIAVSLGLNGRNEVLLAIGLSISGGMTIGAAGELFAIRNVVGPGATRGLARSAAVVSAVTVLSGGVAYAVSRMILGALGESLLSALLAALVAGGLILAGGFTAVYFFDRSTLSLSGKVEPRDRAS